MWDWKNDPGFEENVSANSSNAFAWLQVKSRADLAIIDHDHCGVMALRS
jgi:hypothetical protein